MQNTKSSKVVKIHQTPVQQAVDDLQELVDAGAQDVLILAGTGLDLQSITCWNSSPLELLGALTMYRRGVEDLLLDIDE